MIEIPIRVAINGFGRIGRLVTRVAALDKKIEIVAINNSRTPEELALLLKYDSVHGKYELPVTYGKNFVKAGKNKMTVLNIRDPEQLPWKELKIDVVVECTGVFLTRELASKHLTAGAKKVLLSAPAKDDSIKTIVIGVNDKKLSKKDKIVSNASCTTNCFAPVALLLDKYYGIKQGYMMTVHAYTSDQRIQDGTHKKDYARGRAGALNMIPTSTGSAKAVGKVIPKLDGKLHASALRVPVPDGSFTYFVCHVKKKTTAEKVNAMFKNEAKKLKGILECSDEPLVSSDIIGNTHSSIIASRLTEQDGSMIKVVSWYDNEWGYSNRVVELVKKMAALK